MERGANLQPVHFKRKLIAGTKLAMFRRGVATLFRIGIIPAWQTTTIRMWQHTAGHTLFKQCQYHAAPRR